MRGTRFTGEASAKINQDRVVRARRALGPAAARATERPVASTRRGATAPAQRTTSFKPEKHGDDFVTRRLSVINPFDAGEAAEGEGEEKAGEGF